MEEEAPPRPSVAELAGKFKSSTPAHGPAAGNEAEKPVRRRPPRILQLPKPHTDPQEPSSGLISPLPIKTKRNSALIEKLQANLVLSPSALSPSASPLKSPGFRLLPPSFGLPSSEDSTPTSPEPSASMLNAEECPSSFEDPPTVVEGCVLSSINKGRARHSVRRRPPSRRHRKSSSGEEISNDNDDRDAHLSLTGEGGEKIRGEGEGESVLTPSQEDKSNEEKETQEVEEGGRSSEQQEKMSVETPKQEEDDRNEEKSEMETSS